jgi:hypothetical protein
MRTEIEDCLKSNVYIEIENIWANCKVICNIYLEWQKNQHQGESQGLRGNHAKNH